MERTRVSIGGIHEELVSDRVRRSSLGVLPSSLFPFVEKSAVFGKLERGVCVLNLLFRGVVSGWDWEWNRS